VDNVVKPIFLIVENFGKSIRRDNIGNENECDAAFPGRVKIKDFLCPLRRSNASGHLEAILGSPSSLSDGPRGNREPMADSLHTSINPDRM
jgi:hypothetical protein